MLDALYYTLSETAALTHQNKETLKKRCQSNQIKGAKKIGGVWLIPKEFVYGQKMIKAGIYIDNANVLHGGMKVGWVPDYEKLKDFIERRYLVRVLSIYDSVGYQREAGKLLKDDNGQLVANKSQTNFFNTLQGFGYRVKTKPLKFVLGNPNKPKNNMDANILIDIYKEMDQWDTLILFTGDSDFDPLIDEMIANKKNVHIFSFSSRLSHELKTRALTIPSVCYTLLDDLKTILEKKA